MTSAAEKSELVARSLMAQNRLEKLQSYLDRGRRFEGHNLDRLAQAWLAGISVWSANPFKPQTTMNDAAAEYDLRGIKPPYGPVRDDMERAFAMIDARMKEMSDDELREANARMVADHEQSARSRN